MAMGLAIGHAKDPDVPPCNEDAMIVFDASGSMSGTVGLGIATPVTRIDEARAALGTVLPTATKFRRVGLITYGPGPYQQCNVRLDLKPTPDAAAPIMAVVNSLTPAGRTPLTSGVEQAAEVLDYKHKPGVVVVVTDGEETCGGSPCDLGKKLHAGAYRADRACRSATGRRVSPGPARRASLAPNASPMRMAGYTSPRRPGRS